MDRSAFEGGEPQLQTEEGRFEKGCVQMALPGTTLKRPQARWRPATAPPTSPDAVLHQDSGGSRAVRLAGWPAGLSGC